MAITVALRIPVANERACKEDLLRVGDTVVHSARTSLNCSSWRSTTASNARNLAEAAPSYCYEPSERPTSDGPLLALQTMPAAGNNVWPRT